MSGLDVSVQCNRCGERKGRDDKREWRPVLNLDLQVTGHRCPDCIAAVFRRMRNQ